MTTPTNWTPAVAVLLAALSAGVVLMLRARGGTPLPSPSRSRLDELEQQRDSLYALLRGHTAQGGSGPEWEAERGRLERDAARVLRAIEQVGAEASTPASATPSLGQRHPQLVGALWGAGMVLFFGALALSVQEFQKPRAEGGSMTGGTDMGDGGEAAAISPAQAARIAELQAAVDAAPDDLDAHNRLGHALLHAGKLMDSFQQAEAVVAKRPQDAEARTHQAIVLIAIGDVATAGTALDKVLATDPEFAEALAYRGALYFQAGDRERAITTLEKAVLSDPALADSVAPLIEAAKSGTTPAMATAGSAPAGTSAPPVADAAPSHEDVTGTIVLDAAVADKVKAGDTLFLSARPPGVDRGPPTWVKRLPATTFPLEFRLGPANAMIATGAPPAELVITARIDRDGNAMTHSPEDLEGKSPALAPGTSGVTITLGAAAP